MNGKASTMWWLGWRADSLIFLLALFSHGSAAIVDCSPESQPNVKCEYSTKTEDCPNTDLAAVGTPITAVDEIKIEKYFNNRVNYTGAKISWKSPDAFALNVTGAFTLTLYTYNSTGDKVLILCRHFTIRYLQNSVLFSEASSEFVYLQTALRYYNSQIAVELVTVPAVGTLYVPTLTTTNFTTYGDPLEKYDYHFTKANWSDPYTVSAMFRFPGYNPDIEVLYNHTYYLVFMENLSYELARHIDGTEVAEQIIQSDSIVSEFTEVTFTDLKPSKYRTVLWPYYPDICFASCQSTLDRYQIGSWVVTVDGYDYVPDERPKLFLSTTNKVTLSFQMAPSRLYIIRYDVRLFQPSYPAQIPRSVKSNQSDDWYTHNVTFNTVQVVETFIHINDPIIAEVVPVLDGSICAEPGMCSLNGTCFLCTESKSLPLELPSNAGVVSDSMADVDEKTSSPLIGILVGVAVIVVLLLLIFVPLGVVLKHKKNKQNRRVEIPDDSKTVCTGVTGNGGMSEYLFMGGNSAKTCVAFASTQPTHSQYMKLYETMESIFGTYFNCPLSLYSDISKSNSAEFASHDVVLILCTPELYHMHKKLQSTTNTDAMPMSEMDHCRVRELLVAPRAQQGPTRIMVTFDHIPTVHVKELVPSDNRHGVLLYSLPGDLKKLVAAMYTGEDYAEVSSWKHWCAKGKDLKEELKRNIKQLAGVYRQLQVIQDSGYDDTMTITTAQQFERMDLAPDAITVNTAQQFERMETRDLKPNGERQRQRNEMQEPRTMPLTNGQHAQTADGERLPTLTQPQAEEMVYLRQNSSDIPEHLRHQIQTEIHSVSSERSEPTKSTAVSNRPISAKDRKNSGEMNPLMPDDVDSVYTVNTNVNVPGPILSSSGEPVIARVEV